MKVALLASPQIEKDFTEAFKLVSATVISYQESQKLIDDVIKGSFDCVLVDDKIVGIDVFEVGEKIKESLELAKPPIFLITDKGVEIEDVDLLKCGMDSIIYNKIDSALFKTEIEEKIDLAKSLRTTQHVEDWIEFEIDSDLKYVKEVNRMMEKIFSRSHLKKDELFKMEYSFREMIQNAWEHGNGQDESKRIKISYVLFDDRILIKIEDEGSGFLLDEVEDPTQDPVGAMTRRKDSGKRAGGWGIASVKKIMDDLMYSEKGNTVLMVKYIS